MMLLKSVRDIEAFTAALDRCRGDVYLHSCDGTEELNLKSKLSQYIAIGELCKERGDEWEIYCMNKADENYLLAFFYDMAHPDEK